ncbi:MAG: helix-turn-helix transcriptional regulator [Planctomycetes bacterium]|nr:helix-turn-helix transcriptional regulator [Planctomycetota bacterium]
MEKSTFSPLYEAFRAHLLALRLAAGLSQRELAILLGRERSFVARIEQGERRVDLVEFYWICRACGIDAIAVAQHVMRVFQETEGRSASAHGPERKRRLADPVDEALVWVREHRSSYAGGDGPGAVTPGRGKRKSSRARGRGSEES